VVRVPEKLGQMNEDVANKLGYGGIAVSGNAPGLAVEIGWYGDGDVSDSGHGFGFLWRTEFCLWPIRTIVRKLERFSAKLGENNRLGVKEMLDISGGRDWQGLRW
jgi:hypothetical protein